MKRKRKKKKIKVECEAHNKSLEKVWIWAWTLPSLNHTYSISIPDACTTICVASQRRPLIYYQCGIQKYATRNSTCIRCRESEPTLKLKAQSFFLDEKIWTWQKKKKKIPKLKSLHFIDYLLCSSLGFTFTLTKTYPHIFFF